tara:strand:+ start:134 stop:769 length:636 start_codon:yes stop_codon:yes gene_type:complete
MKNRSKESHDNTMYNLHSLEFWGEHNQEHINKVFDNEELKVSRLLEKNPSKRKNAIDIGSGGGWMSKKLSSIFENVYSIEPSSKAVSLCKSLYDSPNITWIEGYAEDVLQNSDIPKSDVFINTCSVFMHIDDKDVIPTLNYINKNFTDSIFSFQEFWSEEISFNKPLTNCRTKGWWKSHLSNWDLDFHGPSMAQYGNTYKNFFKGIHGYKK